LYIALKIIFFFQVAGVLSPRKPWLKLKYIFVTELVTHRSFCPSAGRKIFHLKLSRFCGRENS